MGLILSFGNEENVHIAEIETDEDLALLELY